MNGAREPTSPPAGSTFIIDGNDPDRRDTENGGFALAVNLYEAMFVVDAARGGSAVPDIVRHIAGLVTRHEAEIERIELWDERKLAYPIQKAKRGMYFLVYFRADAEAIAELRATIRLSEQILRLLILRAEKPGPVKGQLYTAEGELPETPAEPTAAPAEPTAAPAEPTAAPAEPSAEPTAAPAEPSAEPTPEGQQTPAAEAVAHLRERLHAMAERPAEGAEGAEAAEQEGDVDEQPEDEEEEPEDK